MLLFVLTSTAVSYVRMERNDKSINHEYENHVVSLLYDNSISADRELIPQNNSTAENLYAEFLDCGEERFLTAALGEGYALSDDGVYTKGGKSLIKNGDSTVYTESPPPTGANDANYREQLLSLLGVDLKLYKLTENKASGGVRYSAHYKEYEIFDSYIDIETDEEKMTVTFRNPIKSCVETDGKSTVFSGAGVLASLPQNSSLNGKLPASVTEMKLGAAVNSNGKDLKCAFLTPVWQISTDTCGNIYYDSRNGKPLQEIGENQRL